MEARTTPRFDTVSILGVIGGALLALGSFLTWASVSINVDAIAAAFGIDPEQIPPGSIPETSRSFTGLDGTDGKFTLIAGILVIVGALVVWSMRNARRAGGALMLIAGLGGGALALLDATVRKDDAVDEIATQIAAAGIPGNANDLFSISIGFGLWMCVAGGVLAVVAGVMSLTGGVPATSSTPSVGGPTAGDAAPPHQAPATAPVPVTESAPATGAERSDEPGDGGTPVS